jgi:hypothetical protein
MFGHICISPNDWGWLQGVDGCCIFAICGGRVERYLDTGIDPGTG